MLVAAVKRAAMAVLDRGGLIRNLDYVGDRRLPAKTFLHNAMHERGQYFILKVSSSFVYCNNLHDVSERQP